MKKKKIINFQSSLEGAFCPDVQGSAWPVLRAAVLRKQETLGIYFYLMLSFLSLVSVENECRFHKTP